MSYFTFICPSCQEHFEVSGGDFGRQIKCPACEAPIQVPEQASTNESPPEDIGERGDSFAPIPAERKIQFCQFCGGEILSTARKCEHCGEYVDPPLRSPMSVPSSAYPLEKILVIAKAQKGVLWCVLVSIVCAVGIIAGGNPEQPGTTASPIFLWISLIIIPFELYFVYKLASELKCGVPILWALGMFVPCISLILLLILSAMATNRLKNSGFRVGLMGAKISEIHGLIEKTDG